MPTFIVWGEPDHKVRATSLAQACATTAAAISDPARQIAGLDTLVFWGHGTARKFCGLSPEDFVQRINVWRTINPDLKTVEILTCNARHTENGRDSYTDKVVTTLSRRPNKVADKVNFRALPVCTTPSGKVCHYSILRWHKSNTWAYIAAPKKDELNHEDSHMFAGVITLEDFMDPRGAAKSYPQGESAYRKSNGKLLTDPYALRHNWTIQQFDDYNVKFKQVRQDTYVETGTIGALRGLLVDIK